MSKSVEANNETVKHTTRKARRATLGLVATLWGLALDALWLVAVLIIVSAAIWSLYLYGQQAGWEYPLLTKAAVVIENIWKGVWEHVGRQG